MLSRTTCVIAALLLTVSARAASIPSLYWSAAGGVYRAQVDGSLVEPVVAGFDVGGLALDRVRDRLYFTDIEPRVPVGPTGVVKQATLDGLDASGLVDELPAPTALALDRNAGRVIWSDAELHTISTAWLDGSHEQTIYGPLIDRVQLAGLAFDPWERKVYFSFVNPLIDGLFPGGIGRMDLNGENAEVVVSGLASPLGVAVDHVRKQLYWTDELFGEGGVVTRSLLDGSERVDLTSDVLKPVGVAVNPVNGNVYWTDRAAGKLQTLDALGTVVDLVSELDEPRAIGVLYAFNMLGDTNDDGQVDVFDLNNVRNHFAKIGDQGDADGDHDADLDDLNAVRNFFGTRFEPPISAAPEPGTAWLGLVAVAALGAVVRAWKRRPLAHSAPRSAFPSSPPRTS